MSVRILTLSLVLSVALLGCPPKDETKKEGLGPCKKVGQSCEFLPGKLGTCVSIDACDKPPCGFVCQSQH